MSKANQEIRKMAKDNGVHLWEIAERLGILDTTFSRMLRHPLPSDMREKVLDIIKEISEVEV